MIIKKYVLHKYYGSTLILLGNARETATHLNLLAKCTEIF